MLTILVDARQADGSHMLTSLFHVSDLLAQLPDPDTPDTLLLRVIDATGAGCRHLGAVRVYRGGSPPSRSGWCPGSCG